MLHHANVDRLIALWQAIYYNSTIYTIGDYEAALYGTAAGFVGVATPLKPFYDTAENFHTSTSVKNIGVFGYTYPELQPTSTDGQQVMASPEELSRYVKFKVNALYTENSTKYERAFQQYRSHRTSHGAGTGEMKEKTWSIVIQVDKVQVPLPATVNCYIGEELIGKMALLQIPTLGVTHSTIPLDGALATSAGVNLGDEDNVLEFLDQAMKFDLEKVRCSWEL